MLIGLLMILAPCAIYLFSLPFSKRLRPGLCRAYRILGGLVVFAGGGFSFYLASYSGDQGGIAAFFFQIIVITLYAALSLSLLILNWIWPAKESARSED